MTSAGMHRLGQMASAELRRVSRPYGSAAIAPTRTRAEHREEDEGLRRPWSDWKKVGQVGSYEGRRLSLSKRLAMPAPPQHLSASGPCYMWSPRLSP
jgi:hypothetical protein